MKCKLVSLHLVKLLENLWLTRLRLSVLIDSLQSGSKISCLFMEVGILLLNLYYEIIHYHILHLFYVCNIIIYYGIRCAHYVRTYWSLSHHRITPYSYRRKNILGDKKASRHIAWIFFQGGDLNQYLIGISFDLPPIPIPSLREGGSDFHIEKDLQSTYIFI